MYNIQEIEFATPEHDTMVRLRYDVLRKPLGLEFDIDFIAKEYADHLFGIYDAHHHLLGCLIMTKKNAETLKMRQVAVAENLQGKGVGSALVRAVEIWSKQKGFNTIELNARATAVPFYKNLAYESIGELFEEVGITHRFMRKLL